MTKAAYISPRAHSVMFHHFHGGPHPMGQGAVSADDLERLIAFMGPQNILPAKEWMERALAGTLRQGDLALSFDDALRCQYDVALPVLKKYGLTAFWFVMSAPFKGEISKMEVYRYYRTVSFSDVDQFYQAFDEVLGKTTYSAEVNRALEGFVAADYLSQFPFYTLSDRRFRYVRDIVLGQERYERVMDRMVEESDLDMRSLPSLLWMDEACLLDLQGNDHVIGLHSHSHSTALAAMPVDVQEQEYRLNQGYLKEVLGSGPNVVAHPCNSYSEATLNILNKLGVTVGFCSNMAEINGSMLELPRQDHINVFNEMTKSCA